MIFVGYQGIGKTTLSNVENGFIDLESSKFFVDGERQENWYKIYAELAISLSAQGYNVFTSSHQILRDYLNELKIKFVTISPDISLKDYWVERLEKRYKGDPIDKNYKAYMNCKLMFDDGIKQLQSEKRAIIIKSKDYVLKDLIDNYFKTKPLDDILL